jgi:hypothetical protein
LKVPFAFASLLLLAGFTSGQNLVEQSPPKEVLQEFVKMELEGARLKPEGRRNAEHLLVRPITALPDTIDIVSDEFQIHETPPTKGSVKLDLYFPYFYGWLDSALRFKTAPHTARGNGLLREGINAAYVLVPADGSWRIENPPSFTMISLATATRYVTEARNNTADPAIKKNALDTLAKLKKLPPK